MYQNRPISEVAPICRLLDDEKPPIGKDVWLITKYGHGYRGRYHKDFDTTVVAWAPLPKLTEAQKDIIHKKHKL